MITKEGHSQRLFLKQYFGNVFMMLLMPQITNRFLNNISCQYETLPSVQNTCLEGVFTISSLTIFVPTSLTKTPVVSF